MLKKTKKGWDERKGKELAEREFKKKGVGLKRKNSHNEDKRPEIDLGKKCTTFYATALSKKPEAKRKNVVGKIGGQECETRS